MFGDAVEQAAHGRVRVDQRAGRRGEIGEGLVNAARAGRRRHDRRRKASGEGTRRAQDCSAGRRGIVGFAGSMSDAAGTAITMRRPGSLSSIRNSPP